MSILSYKTKLRLWSLLHPIRTYKAWYFDRYIQFTDKWHEIVANNPKKAFEMKWNLKKGTTKLPESFLKAYDIKETAIVTPDNYLDWLI